MMEASHRFASVCMVTCHVSIDQLVLCFMVRSLLTIECFKTGKTNSDWNLAGAVPIEYAYREVETSRCECRYQAID